MIMVMMVLVLLLLVLTVVVGMMSTASEMMPRMRSWKWKHPDIIGVCLWQNSGMIMKTMLTQKIDNHVI